MYYKLSCNSELATLENEFKAKYIYANLYTPKPVVNGLNDNILSIVSSHEKPRINYATWGLLPKDYKGEWYTFQNITNTLNINISNKNFHKIENLDRCIILVSGFFIHYLYKGEMYPILIESPDKKPFALAGVYSELSDGFLTCALIINKSENKIAKFTNITEAIPMIIQNSRINDWLDYRENWDNIAQIQNSNQKLKLSATLILKEAFEKNLISYIIPNNQIYNELNKLITQHI